MYLVTRPRASPGRGERAWSPGPPGDDSSARHWPPPLPSPAHCLWWVIHVGFIKVDSCVGPQPQPLNNILQRGRKGFKRRTDDILVSSFCDNATLSDSLDSISKCLLLISGLGAGLGWLLTRWSLSVSELGSPTVTVPVTFTNNNNPVITNSVDVDVAATNTNNDNDQLTQNTQNTNNNSNGKRRRREISLRSRHRIIRIKEERSWAPVGVQKGGRIELVPVLSCIETQQSLLGFNDTQPGS